MDSTKLEKEFYRNLPFWLRVKNKILDVFDFFDGIYMLFEMAIGFLVILPFIVLFGPFVLLYQIANYYIFRKK